MSGIKGRSGRPVGSIQMKGNRADSQRKMTQLLPGAIEVIEKTIKGELKDRLRYEAATELKDSVMGKPRQQTDIDLKGGNQLGAGLVVELFKILSERQKQLQGGKQITTGDDLNL